MEQLSDDYSKPVKDSTERLLKSQRGGWVDGWVAGWVGTDIKSESLGQGCYDRQHKSITDLHSQSNSEWGLNVWTHVISIYVTVGQWITGKDTYLFLSIGNKMTTGIIQINTLCLLILIRTKSKV